MSYLKIALKIEKVTFLFNNTDAVENCGILSFDHKNRRNMLINFCP